MSILTSLVGSGVLKKVKLNKFRYIKLVIFCLPCLLTCATIKESAIKDTTKEKIKSVVQFDERYGFELNTNNQIIGQSTVIKNDGRIIVSDIITVSDNSPSSTKEKIVAEEIYSLQELNQIHSFFKDFKNFPEVIPSSLNKSNIIEPSNTVRIFYRSMEGFVYEVFAHLSFDKREYPDGFLCIYNYLKEIKKEVLKSNKID